MPRGQGRALGTARGGTAAAGRLCRLGAVSGSVQSPNFPNFLKINNINFLEFFEVLALPKQLPIRFLVLESFGIWF